MKNKLKVEIGETTGIHLHSSLLNVPTKFKLENKKVAGSFCKSVFVLPPQRLVFNSPSKHTRVHVLFCFVVFFQGKKKSFLKDVKISENCQEHNLSIGSMKASNLQSNWDGYKDWINTT